MKQRILLGAVFALGLLLGVLAAPIMATPSASAETQFQLQANLFLFQGKWFVDAVVPGSRSQVAVAPECPSNFQGVIDLLNSPDSGWKSQILQDCSISGSFPPQPVPTAVPTPVPPPAPFAQCGPSQDNVQLVANGTPADRADIGESFRWTINELSWIGSGFGGLDRAIVILPPLNGRQVFVLNSMTRRVVAFCDDPRNVALTGNVSGLVQASRAPDGSQPSPDEIPVMVFDLSGFNVLKAGGPALGTIAAHLQVQ